MKIIIRNEPPEAPTFSWAGTKFNCGHCKSSLELEKGDSTGTFCVKEGEGYTNHLAAECPVCHTIITEQV